MSFTPSYTITTISSSFSECRTKVARTAPILPFRQNIRQPIASCPSTTIVGPSSKFPIGCELTFYSPIARWYFNESSEDITQDDSGNNLTGTLTCSYGDSGGAYTDGTCVNPSFNITSSLLRDYGAKSLQISGGWDNVTNTQIQKAGRVQFQNLITEPKWKILTGSHSVSFWIKNTAPLVTLRCKTSSGSEYCRDSIGAGSMQLFGMCVDPQLNNPSTTAPTGSFFLLQNQSLMDYHNRGGLSWSFRRPHAGVNPATNTYIEYPYLNRNGVPQEGYFTNNQWDHIMYCVSGNEGDGGRFVTAYINGKKLDTETPSFAAGSKLYGKTDWVGITEDYDYTFSVTASQKTYAPQEYIMLGDCNPVANTAVHFSGSIDQCAIWDRYMDSVQVWKIYQSSGSLFNVIAG